MRFSDGRIAMLCGALIWASIAPAVAQTEILPAISVTAPAGLLGTVDAANEGEVSAEDIQTRPTYRPGEILEAVPGLIVTQHSGEGKANQYFMRGFNLDHGTDLAISVDGMPVNMRTHGHGQGYADLNFMIPELVERYSFRKGPYFADEGDFSSAGAVHLNYFDRLDHNIATLSGGSFGYGRALGISSARLGTGNLIIAGEAIHNDGPWQRPDDFQKLNGVLRYTKGDAQNGFSITGMGYGSRWNATNQIALRAVDSGLIDRFGTLDPSDGGNAQRYSLSGRWNFGNDDHATSIDAFVIRSALALYNDFTYFLDDPVHGDQFRQTDERTIYGVNASRTWFGSHFGRQAETVLGVQTRYDDIHVGLVDTENRNVLSTVREDRVGEGSAGLFAQETLHWTDWFRSTLGLRGDVFSGFDHSDDPANSGTTTAAIASPKLSLTFGPFADTEYYFNVGTGFHSNDFRGTTITVDPNDHVTPQSRVPLLVRSKGMEVGVRTEAIRNVQSTLSLFVLDFDSEILFAGDAGTTEPSRPSRRVGIEFANSYRPLSWLSFDLDLAVTRARFTNDDPVGNHIPGSAGLVIDAAMKIDNLGPWYGGLRLRYFGPRPLIEDASVSSNATALVSASAGYKFSPSLRASLDIFNLLNVKASQIDYFYNSRLPGEPLEGVSDIHFHPVEPVSFRLNLTKLF